MMSYEEEEEEGGGGGSFINKKLTNLYERENLI